MRPLMNLSTRVKNLSIKWKLIHIIMFTMTVALLLASAGFMLNDYAMFQRQRVGLLQAQADMIGAATTAALSFNDPHSGNETLATLKATADINRAYIYSAKGREFASYLRNPATRTERAPVLTGVSSRMSWE